MNYVVGFVAAVPSAKREDFVQHARDAAVVMRECGALRVVECWGKDVPEGKITSFPMAVKCMEDETVCFSWVEWPSKEIHDEAMPKIMADPRLQPDRSPMPFDAKRIIWGGFDVIVEASEGNDP